jgi:PKHD-type hydroxylase
MNWKLETLPYNSFCTYTNVFTEEEIDSIKKLSNSFTEEKGSIENTTRVNINDMRETTIKWIHVTKDSEWLYRKLTDVIKDANEKYFQFKVEELETLQYTIYNEGCFYESHTDFVSAYSRKLSFVLQLSDPSDYEGGDLILKFDTPFHTVQKNKGSIVIFPSYVLHEVTEVTKGNRITLVAWVRGPAFK